VIIIVWAYREAIGESMKMAVKSVCVVHGAHARLYCESFVLSVVFMQLVTFIKLLNIKSY